MKQRGQYFTVEGSSSFLGGDKNVPVECQVDPNPPGLESWFVNHRKTIQEDNKDPDSMRLGDMWSLAWGFSASW